MRKKSRLWSFGKPLVGGQNRPGRAIARRGGLAFEALESRTMLVGEDVAVRFEFTDLASNPVTELQSGSDFLLRVHVRDARVSPNTPSGIFQAFLDVNYNNALATAVGPISHVGPYNHPGQTSGTINQASGLIDDVGGVDTDGLPPNPAGTELLLFSVRMTATGSGTLTVTGDLAETRHIVLFDSPNIVPIEEIEFLGGSIQVISAGINISPTSGLTTTEAGGTATFQASLTSQPTANVTFNLTSSDITEGTISTASLTFTPANWNVPQTVTITGVNDAQDDGNVGYTIVTSAATSTDVRYQGLNPADVSVTNTDDDTAGINVTPVAGLTTTEVGGTATFTVALASQPTANVTIGLTSSNTAEGTVSPASLVFTPANWNTPQMVTVTGMNDQVDDGNVAYSIVTAPATSSDSVYNGLNAADVAVVNTDDDTAGIVVAPTSGLTTAEAGGTATFTIVLTSQPTLDVAIGLSSSDTTEGTVSPASVVFTSANWNVPRTITITGVDDLVDDGNIAYTIVTAAAGSGDPNYGGRAAADVSVTNTNNDTAGILVSAASSPTTTEAGGVSTFTIVLTSQPTADVGIPLSSSDTTEGTVSPASVIFTTANWNVPQTVTVTGVNDFLDDGNIAYSIVTAPAGSADASYAGRNASDVALSNLDDDTAGIAVAPTSGLTTTEAGGTAMFTIVLTSQPTMDVAIPLSSSDTTEGTVSPTAVFFTPANWNVAQTVTITGVNDGLDDGDVAYTIVTALAGSGDASYGGRNAADVSVTNLDDDTAGINVSPTSGLTTTEAGGTATFTIVLGSQPTANVTIGLSSSNTAEGTVSPASLVFTTANWNTPRTVTVTGVNDARDDGDVAYTIVTAAATSTDPAYSGRNAADVSVTNLDDDTAGINVSPTSGLSTTEAGGTATFSIVLTSQPTGNVTIPLVSSDTTEGTVSPASLVFTTANWNVPQTVTATGVNDAADDGDMGYSIVTLAATSSDVNYSGRNAADVSITNLDDDTLSIIVTSTTGLTTTEAGGTATFTIVLGSQPTANVTVGLSSSNTAEGTVSHTSLVFTTANWNVPQTVTVTGVNDAIDDGDVPYTIVTAAATSSDEQYAGLNPADVSLTNLDNDTAGIQLSQTSGLVTSEVGLLATFTVVLTSQPTANVTIPLSSNDSSEASVLPASLVFTPGNWNVPQTVTVQGVDDAIMDDDAPFSIVTGPAISGDALYGGMDPADVSGVNRDNDVPGITVAPIGGLTTTEAGGTAMFVVVLNLQPTADVTIALSSSDPTEGTPSVASLTFTPANWNEPQNVIVTGQDDLVADGAIAYSIVTAPAASTDPAYNNRNADDVSLTNTDDDVAGAQVIAAPGLTTTEAGGTATFQIVLTSQPTADVTVMLESSDTTEGTVSPASLLFTPGNWNVPQMASIMGQDDLMDDGDVSYTIVTTVSSSDAVYNNIAAADVAVENTDDDTAGIDVSPTIGLVTTEAGGTATFQVVLTAQPTADVTIPLSSSETGEGTVSPASLVFTPGNWNVPQIVTVSGVDDFVQDGAAVYSILTSAATSTDTAYNGLDAADVAAVNSDNDAADVLIMPTSGLSTTESGGTATFDVVLATQPTADVTIPLASNNPAEASVSAASLLFTPDNWNVPQTVTVTGMDDDVIDGDQPVTIVVGPATSSDVNYDGLNPPDVAAIILDDDVASVMVTPVAGLSTTEAGGTATFEMVLTSRPTANVTINLATSDETEGQLSVPSVTFTPDNWNVPQVITIMPVDDFVDDGDVVYTIVTSAAASDDPNYHNQTVADVSITNLDNDTAGINITPTSGLATTEAGGTATFQIVLTSQPADNVTINLASSDTGEGTVSPASVVFTPLNWNVAQTVTVAGVDDSGVDGNVPYAIVTSAAASSDPSYSGLNAADVAVVNSDNDTASLSISAPAAAAEGSSGNTPFVFTVTLTGSVPGGFRVAFATSNGTATLADNDYTAGSGQLTFAGNDGETQNITVQVRGDSKVELSETFSVALGAISQVGSDIAQAISVAGGPAVATINNDDTSTLTITSIALPEGTGDGFSSFVFAVTLSNPVQGGLRVNYTTDNGTALAGQDYTDNDGQLTFAGTAGETQSITVRVSHDADVERDESFSIALRSITGLINSSLASSITLPANPGTGTIQADDSATVSFATAASEAIEANAGAVQVQVTLAIPTGGRLTEDLVVNIVDVAAAGTADSPADYSLSTAAITFAAGTAGGATRNVSVSIVNDGVLEPNETIVLDLGLAADTLGGRITQGATSRHTVTILDDPLNAQIAGVVWIDANNNGRHDAGEPGLGGVLVQLTGRDARNQVVESTVMTADDGSYRFTELPAGTYEIHQRQPRGFMDGQESTAGFQGTFGGQVSNDRFTGVVVQPGQRIVGLAFGEMGVESAYVNARYFLARTPPTSQMLRETLAMGEEQAGEEEVARAVRIAKPVEVRRVGPKVTIKGTAAADSFKFVPAGLPAPTTIDPAAEPARHTVVAGGMPWHFEPEEIDEIVLDGGDGDDTVELFDTTSNDSLAAALDKAILTSANVRVEAIASELVRAVSRSGGDDTADRDAIDFVLQLEGDWEEL